MIDRNPSSRLTLGSLAREAGLSPYHFLRTFERLAGLTPHQYVLRARLRARQYGWPRVRPRYWISRSIAASAIYPISIAPSARNSA